MTDQAFVTLTTNDAYTKGGLALGLVILTTLQVSDSMRKVLETVFDEVIMVDRPELGITLTKLHCWLLTQYSKCVFMEADTLVLANIDDLFEREESSAGPDPRWPDCFNSEVFVYQPSATTDIRKHLPFIYNLSSISIYSHLPAFKVFSVSAKVVHFLGQVKPWNYIYDPKTKSVKSDSHDPNITYPEFLILWWNIFTSNVLPLLQQFGLVKDTISGAISHLSLGEIPAMAQPFVSLEEWKEQWEQGQADYMGADSFDNIKTKVDTYLQ
uniref:Glycogenin 1 n=1 Tax=Nomascus leucogenys TaxID=61853 RepID=A0A2I3H2M8_NOMLE